MSDCRCIHDIDRRYSRCGDCEAEEARSVIRDAASFVRTARPAADWAGLAALAAEGAGRDLGPWTEAKWHSACRACGERWEPGDLIRFDEDEGGWICELCGS